MGYRLAHQAKTYFDHVLSYRKWDLGSEFVEQHAEHFKATRGAGYAVWKPRVLQLALQRMADGDILMYADTGCLMAADPTPLMAGLAHHDVVYFNHRTGGFPERQWTKRDAFIAVGVDTPEVADSEQYITTYFFIRKTPTMVALVDEWLAYMARFHLASDEPSVFPNYPDYVEHRHDQSLWSLLLKKHGHFTPQDDYSWPQNIATILIKYGNYKNFTTW